MIFAKFFSLRKIITDYPRKIKGDFKSFLIALSTTATRMRILYLIFFVILQGVTYASWSYCGGVNFLIPCNGAGCGSNHKLFVRCNATGNDLPIHSEGNCSEYLFFFLIDLTPTPKKSIKQTHFLPQRHLPAWKLPAKCL